jgi:hypothetical protein
VLSTILGLAGLSAGCARPPPAADPSPVEILERLGQALADHYPALDYVRATQQLEAAKTTERFASGEEDARFFTAPGLVLGC